MAFGTNRGFGAKPGKARMRVNRRGVGACGACHTQRSRCIPYEAQTRACAVGAHGHAVGRGSECLAPPFPQGQRARVRVNRRGLGRARPATPNGADASPTSRRRVRRSRQSPRGRGRICDIRPLRRCPCPSYHCSGCKTWLRHGPPGAFRSAVARNVPECPTWRGGTADRRALQPARRQRRQRSNEQE